MGNIIVRGYIIVPDDDIENVKAELPRHIELTRKEEGCVLFGVYQTRKNPNKFDVYEVFINQEAYEHHQQRVRNSHWGKITSDLERHYKITDKP